MFQIFPQMSLSTILSYLEGFVFTLPVLFIAFPVHECAHALTANALGDRTAKNAGRLTLNPMKHLDLLGTICLILFRFGWAKPVPVNPNNFKNPRVGMAVTAVAGPLSNLAMAFLSLGLYRAFDTSLTASGTAGSILLTFLMVSAQINAGLFVFNLIPVPPLDGSRVLMLFLSRGAEATLYRYENIIQVGLMALFFLGFLTKPLLAVQQAVLNAMWAVFA